jgi:hypothetical protein
LLPNNLLAKKWRRSAAIGAGVALALSAIALGSQGTRSSAATFAAVPCVSRVILDDTSSENRSPELASFADQLITTAAESAVACETDLVVDGVAGGGQVTPIVTSDDLQQFTPRGPTPQIRAQRFGGSAQSDLEELVKRRLIAAYRVGDPRITSVAALYEVAHEDANRQVDVVIVTAGVNHDSQVDLNRPLAHGQGAELAKGVQVPRVLAAQVTLVGIGQVDSTLPPPSNVWPAEIRSFNAVVCHESHARSCRLFEFPSVSQALAN